MKVLLAQSYLGRTEPRGPLFPLGLCYVATSLSQRGHEVRVHDMNVHDEPQESLRRAITKFRPDVIGVSLRNIDTTDRLAPFYYYSGLDQTLAVIRSCGGDVPLLIGGSGFSLFPRQIMERHPELTYGVFLEGEEATPELLERLDAPEKVPGVFYRRTGGVHFSGPRVPPDFAGDPAPSRGFVDIASYARPRAIGVQAKRGCPFSCAYCTYPQLNGSTLRLRSPGDVVDELTDLASQGVEEFIFADSVFDAPRWHAEQICQLVIERRVKLRWSAWFEVSGITDQFVSLVRRAGCYRMCFSPDAVTNRSLRALNKPTDEEDVARLLETARRHPDVDFRFSLLVSTPGQDWRGLLRTLRAVVESHVLLKNGKCLVSWIRVLPSTRMQQIALAEGVLDAATDLLPPTAAGLDALFYKNPQFGNWVDGALKSFVRTSSAARRLVRRLRSWED